jgi:hypothetical protein
LCFKWFFHKAVAISAMPMGIPGCPELAFWTASIDKNLIALIESDWFKIFPVWFVRDNNILGEKIIAKYLIF